MGTTESTSTGALLTPVAPSFGDSAPVSAVDGRELDAASSPRRGGGRPASGPDGIDLARDAISLTVPACAQRDVLMPGRSDSVVFTWDIDQAAANAARQIGLLVMAFAVADDDLVLPNTPAAGVLCDVVARRQSRQESVTLALTGIRRVTITGVASTDYPLADIEAPAAGPPPSSDAVAAAALRLHTTCRERAVPLWVSHPLSQALQAMWFAGASSEDVRDAFSAEKDDVAVLVAVTAFVRAKVARRPKERKKTGVLTGNRTGEPTLTERVKSLTLPEDVRALVDVELAGSRRYGDDLEEWLQTVATFPWGVEEPEPAPLEHAAAVLRSRLTGYEDVINRIVDHLALRHWRRLRGGTPGPGERGLLLVGPPGTGKSTAARAIAECLVPPGAPPLPIAHIPLAGATAVQLVGSSRHYLQTQPGAVVKSILAAGTQNCVFVLDEIEKVSTDSRQFPPIPALLSLLDGEMPFVDSFLGLPITPAKHGFFVATANLLPAVHPALRDRLQVITIDAPSLSARRAMCRSHLLPALVSGYHLAPDEIVMTDDAITELVDPYPWEGGVRQLQIRLGRVVAAAIVRLLGGAPQVTIDRPMVAAVVGPPPEIDFFEPVRRGAGEATGLVVGTDGTGIVIPIEASVSAGTGATQVTGGDRWSQDSALTVVSVMRRGIVTPQIDPDADVHIHIGTPGMEIAGPSAGAAIALAVASAVSGVPVRDGLAATGEVTIHGRLRPVGMVKEKILGAERAGFSSVLVPAARGTAPSTDGLRVIQVGTVQEAVRAGLAGPPAAPTRRRSRARLGDRPSRHTRTAGPAAPVATNSPGFAR